MTFIGAEWKKFQFSSGFKCNTDKDCNDRGLCEADGDCRCNANWEASKDCSGEIFDFFEIFNIFYGYCRMQLDLIPIYHNWDSVLGIHIVHNIWKVNCKIDNNIDLPFLHALSEFSCQINDHCNKGKGTCDTETNECNCNGGWNEVDCSGNQHLCFV